MEKFALRVQKKVIFLFLGKESIEKFEKSYNLDNIDEIIAKTILKRKK